ncbi:MAG: biopolymer transporter ExbD [Bdellovibrio sp. CG12_big_fil_rev_8_21_14_0_65_39_13]|nr:MAG: biopolymer transporter ExbD [Bdellovibrio sp. CG22_combo_CG10-13_8_21_14_all_39_27]PIQ57532.1 MAG: biopolymer transporter ExbD [Bdellovibrio sp. CG12_big_fil_rev_8_21_14_0_65_39_13]PIR33735.1 MAG: biopolymer transporter ExbD [Bdellovibrio sp. CG11_big_fil_rev_8_21_14_0_20_39_38]
MKFKDHGEENSNIDISPLIDMVFILLIFFMVSTTFVKDMKLDLERPGASSATPASSKSVRLFIDKSAQVYMDGQSIRPWVIQSKLKEQFQQGVSKSVLVVTDAGVSADKLLEVVDQARLAGATDVGVATDKEGQ